MSITWVGVRTFAILLLLLFSLFAGGYTFVFWLLGNRNTSWELRELLMQVENLRCVGPLAEALAMPDVTREAQASLIRLLPRLRHSDASLLTEGSEKTSMNH